MRLPLQLIRISSLAFGVCWAGLNWSQEFGAQGQGNWGYNPYGVGQDGSQSHHGGMADESCVGQMGTLANEIANLMVQVSIDPQPMYEEVGSVSSLQECQAMIARLRIAIGNLKHNIRVLGGGGYPNIDSASEIPAMVLPGGERYTNGGPISEMPAGAFKFEGRSPIYYSNGSGQYCWYRNWNDYVRLTGNRGWREIPGRPGDYTMTYDGICTGAQSIPAPHPDPG